jgi:hypothetical protein
LAFQFDPVSQCNRAQQQASCAYHPGQAAQGEEKTPLEGRLSMTWARRLQRVFAIDKVN